MTIITTTNIIITWAWPQGDYTILLLYYTILYYTILYYTILYAIIHYTII